MDTKDYRTFDEQMQALEQPLPEIKRDPWIDTNQRRMTNAKLPDALRLSDHISSAIY